MLPLPYEPQLWYLQHHNQLDYYRTCPNRSAFIQASEFIAKVSRKLGFPFRTIATAQLYFHLFFHRQILSHPSSAPVQLQVILEKFPSLDIALTSLLVASKAEETWKRIRQILSAAFIILNPNFKGSELDVKIVEEHRQRVIQYEHLLLEAIEYNFFLAHAHIPLLSLFRMAQGEENQQSEKDRNRAWFREALAWLQQCYCTPAVLFYPPEMIALAALLSDPKEVSKGSPTLQLVERMSERLGIPTGSLQRLRSFVVEYHQTAISDTS